MKINGHNELQHVKNWFWLILYIGTIIIFIAYIRIYDNYMYICIT
jgi:hypothetical protein